MFAAFIEASPIAVGIVLATLPLISVSLFLIRRPERSAHNAFLGGWAVGAVFVGSLAIAISDISTPNRQPPAPWVVWCRLLLGLCLVALAARKFVSLSSSKENGPPEWMAALESLQPVKAFALGAGLATLNPKNAALFVSGALTIAAATYAPVSQLVALAFFVAVSSLGLAMPLVFSLTLGERAERIFLGLSELMEKYSKLIVAIVLAVLGVMVFANAVTDL
ncbi:GAP family protein [Ruegeria arenilitoris]|uniref:GAP family protein n=1 Tax=Ruegeria arenilitoris TaxID=1173585 RepID=UPI00147D86E7|nr:GAP family protein [Ruegeria arenilitoris]